MHGFDDNDASCFWTYAIDWPLLDGLTISILENSVRNAYVLSVDVNWFLCLRGMLFLVFLGSKLLLGVGPVSNDFLQFTWQDKL